jgi:hypothetical protein
MWRRKVNIELRLRCKTENNQPLIVLKWKAVFTEDGKARK